MSRIPKRYSPSVEDYLKAVFALTERGEPASTSALAASLDVQPASVTGMVKRLAEEGLLEHLPYRGVRLTDAGHREALRILRRHRILETYLTERLDYSWDDVHAEAERLEHAASDRLIEAMAGALDDPSHDPHGAPIPTAAGEIAASHHLALADVDAGSTVLVRAVDDEDPASLRSMQAEGLRPGVRVRVERIGPDAQDLVVCVGDDPSPRHVAMGLARRIFVSTTDA